MSKMGLHDPFRYLKHKLWSKKGSRVKLVIWLPTTKSQESPRFLVFRWCATHCWKALDKGYNYFKLHFNRRSTHKVMGPQSCKRLSCENFGQNDIWVLIPWLDLHTKLWAPKVAEVRTVRILDKMTFGC